MHSRLCTLGTAGLLFLCLLSSRLVAGLASRKFLGCVGECAKAGPPSLSMSWGDTGHQSGTEKGSGAPVAFVGWSSDDGGDQDEEQPVGRRGESEELGFPEVEAQQYYKLDILESLSQSLGTTETSPSSTVEPSNACNSIPGEITRYANLVLLAKALEVTGLADTLRSEELEATLFAPTDLAFETLVENRGISVEELFDDTEYLSKVLKLHLAPSALNTFTLGASQSVDTYLVGHPILVTSSEKGILVVPPGGDAAHIQLADIGACSSVIHIVDRVLSYVEDWDLGMFTG